MIDWGTYHIWTYRSQYETIVKYCDRVILSNSQQKWKTKKHRHKQKV